MAFKLVTATINDQMLEAVEHRLRDLAVPGLDIWRTKGYGAYKNFFDRDFLASHARIEVYTPEQQALEVAEAIMDVACTGADSDGLVMVSPVERLFRIRDRSEVNPDG